MAKSAQATRKKKKPLTRLEKEILTQRKRLAREEAKRTAVPRFKTVKWGEKQRLSTTEEITKQIEGIKGLPSPKSPQEYKERKKLGEQLQKDLEKAKKIEAGEAAKIMKAGEGIKNPTAHLDIILEECIDTLTDKKKVPNDNVIKIMNKMVKIIDAKETPQELRETLGVLLKKLAAHRPDAFIEIAKDAAKGKADKTTMRVVEIVGNALNPNIDLKLQFKQIREGAEITKSEMMDILRAIEHDPTAAFELKEVNRLLKVNMAKVPQAQKVALLLELHYGNVVSADHLIFIEKEIAQTKATDMLGQKYFAYAEAFNEAFGKAPVNTEDMLLKMAQSKKGKEAILADYSEKEAKILLNKIKKANTYDELIKSLTEGEKIPDFQKKFADMLKDMKKFATKNAGLADALEVLKLVADTKAGLVQQNVKASGEIAKKNKALAAIYGVYNRLAAVPWISHLLHLVPGGKAKDIVKALKKETKVSMKGDKPIVKVKGREWGKGLGLIGAQLIALTVWVAVAGYFFYYKPKKQAEKMMKEMRSAFKEMTGWDMSREDAEKLAKQGPDGLTAFLLLLGYFKEREVKEIGEPTNAKYLKDELLTANYQYTTDKGIFIEKKNAAIIFKELADALDEELITEEGLLKGPPKKGKIYKSVEKLVAAKIDEWEEKRLIVPMGKVYVEYYCEKVWKLSKEHKDYLIGNPKLFVEIWGKVKGGSLPRAFIDDYVAAKIEGTDLPTELTNPFEINSLMDVYDQHVLYNSKYEKGFEKMFDSYIIDLDAQKNLNSFMLAGDELVYGSIAQLAKDTASPPKPKMESITIPHKAIKEITDEGDIIIPNGLIRGIDSKTGDLLVVSPFKKPGILVIPKKMIKAINKKGDAKLSGDYVLEHTGEGDIITVEFKFKANVPVSARDVNNGKNYIVADDFLAKLDSRFFNDPEVVKIILKYSKFEGKKSKGIWKWIKDNYNKFERYDGKSYLYDTVKYLMTVEYIFKDAGNDYERIYKILDNQKKKFGPKKKGGKGWYNPNLNKKGLKSIPRSLFSRGGTVAAISKVTILPETLKKSKKLKKTLMEGYIPIEEDYDKLVKKYGKEKVDAAIDIFVTVFINGYYITLQTTPVDKEKLEAYLNNFEKVGIAILDKDMKEADSKKPKDEQLYADREIGEPVIEDGSELAAWVLETTSKNLGGKKGKKKSK